MVLLFLVPCTDFHFSSVPLPDYRALHNLRKVVSYAATHLSPPCIHLSAEELQRYSTLFTENVQVMLAQMFHQLELRAAPLPGLPPAGSEDRKHGQPLLPKLRTSVCNLPLTSTSLTNLSKQPVVLHHCIAPATGGGVSSLQSFSTPNMNDTTFVVGDSSLGYRTHTLSCLGPFETLRTAPRLTKIPQ